MHKLMNNMLPKSNQIKIFISINIDNNNTVHTWATAVRGKRRPSPPWKIKKKSLKKM